MSSKDTNDLGDFSMLELFQAEASMQTEVLSENLLNLESNPEDASKLEALMRAAHSIKGAARMVDISLAVDLAHSMEDCFVAAQNGKLQLNDDHVDILLKCVDLMKEISDRCTDNSQELAIACQAKVESLLRELLHMQENGDGESATTAPSAPETPPTESNDSGSDKSSENYPSMLDLFRMEAEGQTATLTENLLELEENPKSAECLEAVMRAAHSLKGAARMVDIDAAVRLAHVMEDCFVAAQNGKIELDADHIDSFLKSIDILTRISINPELAYDHWPAGDRKEYDKLLDTLSAINNSASTASAKPIAPTSPKTNNAAPAAGTTKEPSSPKRAPAPAQAAVRKDNAIRVSAENLNRLMGLSGEAMVGARWLRPFSESLLQLKRRQVELISVLDTLWDRLEGKLDDEYIINQLKDAQTKATDCRHFLSNRLIELEEYDRRTTNVSTRLNREVVASRMRPFSDGLHGFQRMIRDLARSLGKEIKLDIHGLSTQVDRDILEKIEAPLNHLLRNAVDHGIESPEERVAAGKPAQATITLEASHSSGMLSIDIKDNGRGIDLERLREKIVEKGLVQTSTAKELSESELLEFLFLPGFSTRSDVTEVSGRGVGLDVVHSVVQEMRGVVRAHSTLGKGTRFQMQLPLTLSVIRALLVEISGEPYAFPLARIDHTLKLPKSCIEIMEGRQYFTLGNQHIGIVTASQILEVDSVSNESEEMEIIVIGERLNRYGLVVDRFLGERNLVVRPLDNRLGKVKDIGAAAFMEDGTLSLIVDVDDLIRSIDLLLAGGRLNRVAQSGSSQQSAGKRILVVDDSITIREVERNMLENRGYMVEIAVDGMDGWNAVRTGNYDLVISDIDMPRMNGIEFVGHIKKDPRLKNLPVMIVSYKDREEDRAAGMEAGADYYITKGSFHDETLLDAVADLIGEAL